MPVILRILGFSFSFFASDRDEPMHVHVKKAGNHAKYWLKPTRLANVQGFTPHELRLIAWIIDKNENQLQQGWNDYFGTGRES